MIKIYHNPRCSKSREGLEILKESGKNFEIIDYMKDQVSTDELAEIVKLLKVKPIDLVRKNETLWKEKYQNRRLSDQQIIEIMTKNPKLIERPIVINSNKAVLGRPSVLIKDVL